MTVSGAHVSVPYTLSTKKSVRLTFFATLLTNEFNYSGQMTVSVAQEFPKTFVRLTFLVSKISISIAFLLKKFARLAFLLTKISVSIAFLLEKFARLAFLVTKISATSSFLTKKSVRSTFFATFLTNEFKYSGQMTVSVAQEFPKTFV